MNIQELQNKIGKREIKFRGRCIETGKWHYGLLLKNKKGTFIVTENNPLYCHQYGYIEVCDFRIVEPKTFGQYTGLKDKNGTKIFEGDIVKSTTVTKTIKSDMTLNNGLVMHDDEGCDYNIVDKNGNFISAFGFSRTKYEVMGNIFENPDLLSPQDDE